MMKYNLVDVQGKGYKPGDRERLRLERKYYDRFHENLKLRSVVSYVGNRDIPLLRLFRYKEAFAFEFVRYFLRYLNISPQGYVFDPFAGMGTTLFASMTAGIPSIGVDKLPVAEFIARTLPKLLFIKSDQIIRTYMKLKNIVDKCEPADVAMDVPIMKLAFDDITLTRLRQWKSAINIISEPMRDIFLLLFLGTLESTSYTSKDGQFLRLRRDKKPEFPDDALERKINEAVYDLDRIKWLFPHWNGVKNNLPRVFLSDTRDLHGISFQRKPTAIITSPPYANRYDYTRTYSLELCFNFVKNFEELRDIRNSILRSHIESKVSDDERSPHPAVEEVITFLKDKELNNPRIPYMLKGYFIDMQLAVAEWNRVLAHGASVALVVDNVRFEGELVPVDLILSEMAEMVDFEVEAIIVTRYKGNSSQQMKKYGKIPVRESVVIWRKI